MMVRCGYEWTGHPVTADGQIYTLHGKAGNTPASLVEVEVADSAPYEIHIRGLVKRAPLKSRSADPDRTALRAGQQQLQLT